MSKRNKNQLRALGTNGNQLPATGGSVGEALVGLVAALNPLESIHKMYLTRKLYDIEVRRLDAEEKEAQRRFQLDRERLEGEFRVRMDALRLRGARCASRHRAFDIFLEDGRQRRIVLEETLGCLTKFILDPGGADTGVDLSQVLELISDVRADLRKLDEGRKDALFELLSDRDSGGSAPALPRAD